MLDFILLLIAGVCQLVLGLLGLDLTVRRSTKAQKRHYEWVFIIFGLIGLGALVWSGTRSTAVQNGIAAGIEKIEAKIGVATAANRSESARSRMDEPKLLRCRVGVTIQMHDCAYDC